MTTACQAFATASVGSHAVPSVCGDASPAGLAHIYFRQLSVFGATMGTVDELKRLVRFCVSDGIRPLIHDVLPLQDARSGFEALNAENVVGKIVLTV